MTIQTSKGHIKGLFNYYLYIYSSQTQESSLQIAVYGHVKPNPKSMNIHQPIRLHVTTHLCGPYCCLNYDDP